MGFYLRKSFSLGPLRLNLSKSGLGASVGVRGARVGVSGSGRAYLHAGRGGVYYRQRIGSSRRGGATGRHPVDPAADRTAVLYEDTGVTYPVPEAEGDVVGPARLAPTSEGDPRVAPWLLLPAAGLVALAVAGATTGVAQLVASLAAATLLLAWVLPVRRAVEHREARAALRRALDAALADRRPLEPAALAPVDAALHDPRLNRRAGVAELRGAYLRTAVRVAEDGHVDADEAELLLQLEERFHIDASACAAARQDAYQALYFAAVADRELTAVEEASLEQVQQALRVDAGRVAPEHAVLERLRRLREIRAGHLPTVEAGVPLEPGEVCRYRAPARLLREKGLRRFQRDGRRYAVRGLVVRGEGTLLVTSRRVLVVAGGATSVPLSKILHLDVDLDRNLLRLTKDGRSRPVLITTPDATEAGAVIAAAAGL